MSLDHATVVAVQNHLAKVWRNQNCQLCGVNSWELHGFVTLGLTDFPGVPPMGIWAQPSASLPCVALVCQNCGNTVLINLVVAKVPMAAPPGFVHVPGIRY